MRHKLKYLSVIFGLFLLLIVIKGLYPKINSNKFYKISTLDDIFNNDRFVFPKPPREKLVIVNATGDVAIARSINYRSVTRNDYHWYFDLVSKTLSQSDITLISLESPFVENCPITKKKIAKFCASPKNIESLKTAGVDIVNLANNHIYDYGQSGLERTIELLKASNITYSGLTEPASKVVKNTRFTFLGFNDIDESPSSAASATNENITKTITEAKKNADVVIVSFHWGLQYTSQPASRQIYLAHLAIDSGADVILGNHPHWIQPAELYKGKLIIYSHGNFVFDMTWSEETRLGIVSRLYFYNKSLIKVELLPVRMGDLGEPYFLFDNEGKTILNNIKKNSEQLLNSL